MKIFLLIGFVFFFIFHSSGQIIEIDKKYEITGAAEKGLLAHVEFDKTDGFYRLFYISKLSDSKIVVRNYLFDLDFNFLDMKENILEVEAVKKKYDWAEDFFINESAKNKDTSSIKIPDKMVKLIKRTSVDSFEIKIKSPDQDKPNPFIYKDFEMTNYKTDSIGNIFITGQNIGYITKIIKKKKVMRKIYTDVFTLQFDDKGIFKTQYCVSVKENNQTIKNFQEFFENTKQNSMYWLLLDNKGLAAWNKQPLSSPRIFKIDLKNNSITNVLDFGDVDFYLEPQFPYLYNAWIHAIVFLGSDKTGKWIHIYKCRIE